MRSQTRVDQLIASIRRAAARRRLTQRSLAKLAGLHPNTLLHFYDQEGDEWSPSIDTLRALERTLLPQRATHKNAA